MYSVWETKQELKNSIKVYLEKDSDGRYLMDEVNRMPFFLVGAPGVGKTQLTEQVAKELGIGFVSLSITHHTRNTVLGLPVIQSLQSEAEGKYTAYTMSEIIAQVMKETSEGKKEGILLIDEFACMAESLIAPMLAFLQTKNIGNFTLPEGWIMVLCSNPPRYNKNSRTFDMAIMDRVRVMEVDFNAQEFLEYGQKQNFHPVILEYLKLNRLDTHVCEWAQDKTQIIVTTRGWENLSHCLKGYERQDLPVKEELITQFIKSGEIARKFFFFYNTFRMGDMELSQLREILEGKNIDKYAAIAESKSYGIRWNLMVQLYNLLFDRATELEESVSCSKEYRKFCQTLREGKNNKSILSEVMQQISFTRKKQEQDWLTGLQQTYYKRSKEEGINTIKQEDSDKLMNRLMEEIQSEQEAEVMKRSIRLSEEINGACTFISKIEKGDNLTESFIHMLNKHVGIMDAMSRVENPVYLKYLRKAYGNEEAS